MSRRAPRFDRLVSNAPANAEVLDASPEARNRDLDPSTEEQASEQATWTDLQNEATSANKESLELVRRGATKDAFDKLCRAQELLSQAERYCPAASAHELAAARAAMESSFAICHKRDGNHAMVVRHLETALELYEGAGADHRTLMATRLNLSACYAEAEMPSEALEHAKVAVVIGGQLIAQQQSEGPAETSGKSNHGRRQVTLTGLSSVQMVRPDDYAMLAVAYHKTAEAHERLRQWGQATLAYTQAYEVVRRSLGPTHHLTKAFEKSARCPRRPLPPEVPLSWRMASSGAKKLPNLPHIQRTPRQSPGGSTPREILGYKLDSASFPSWPPKPQSEEEDMWYTMAQQDRKQTKHALLSQIQDMKGASRITSGQLSMDREASLSPDVLGDRNMATQMGGSRLVEWT
mmetsp:Transcript_67513/g.106942  ORF Transcript_67513/g.106942 Transcript_67513/m.106942 type:complete len:406 (-) Transcript_67513:121-1338(-)